MARLYDELNDYVSKSGKEYDMSTETIEKLAYYLSQIEKDSQEICLALIFEFYIRIHGEVKLQERTLPYKGKTVLKNMGAKFVLSVFPEDLIRLLMVFIEKGTNQRLFQVKDDQ